MDPDAPDAGWWRHPFWAGLPAGARSDLGAYLFWFVGLPLTIIATGASGPVLILMTLPLLITGLLGWWRARKTTS